jgi:hypothetical protein
MTNAIWNISSIAIGALITWLVARRYYYVRAALDLELETKKIRNLLRIALQALEDAGMVKLNRDSSGQIVGMVHDVSINLSASASFKGSESNEVKGK